PLDLQRARDVVRQEERGQRDHDQVVEEQRPAGEEAEEVVERLAHEGRRAAGLRDRRGALGVRERDEQEERADEEEHDRREPERVQRDDPEGEVDRRRDLSVGDRERRRSVSRPRPAATKKTPRTKPTAPPPRIAVATTSAIPIPTNVTPKIATPVR